MSHNSFKDHYSKTWVEVASVTCKHEYFSHFQTAAHLFREFLQPCYRYVKYSYI